MSQPELVDVQKLDVVDLLDRCKCGQQYISHLHLRHECPDCNAKWIRSQTQESFFSWMAKKWRDRLSGTGKGTK